MVILITGASHTGKTALAQRLLTGAKAIHALVRVGIGPDGRAIAPLFGQVFRLASEIRLDQVVAEVVEIAVVRVGEVDHGIFSFILYSALNLYCWKEMDEVGGLMLCYKTSHFTHL